MKKLISAMLAMAMCFSLAACGAKEEPAPAPAPAPEASQPAEPAPAPSNPGTADVTAIFSVLASLSAVAGLAISKRK